MYVQRTYGIDTANLIRKEDVEQTTNNLQSSLHEEKMTRKKKENDSKSQKKESRSRKLKQKNKKRRKKKSNVDCMRSKSVSDISRKKNVSKKLKGLDRKPVSFVKDKSLKGAIDTPFSPEHLKVLVTEEVVFGRK